MTRRRSVSTVTFFLLVLFINSPRHVLALRDLTVPVPRYCFSEALQFTPGRPVVLEGHPLTVSQRDGLSAAQSPKVFNRT
jgi:hypothetical protein